VSILLRIVLLSKLIPLGCTLGARFTEGNLILRGIFYYLTTFSVDEYILLTISSVVVCLLELKVDFYLLSFDLNDGLILLAAGIKLRLP
jgi:hypothetical protein